MANSIFPENGTTIMSEALTPEEQNARNNDLQALYFKGLEARKKLELRLGFGGVKTNGDKSAERVVTNNRPPFSLRRPL